MTRKDKKALLAEMEEIRSLLLEFNLRLVGYQPGITANVIGKTLPSKGYAGEHIDLSAAEWNWLRPLLEELRKLRIFVQEVSKNAGAV